MREKMELAVAADGEMREMRRSEQIMERRQILNKLKEARRFDNRENILNGWRQSMSGPDFEVDPPPSSPCPLPHVPAP
jgi:hypothetical protein